MTSARLIVLVLLALAVLFGVHSMTHSHEDDPGVREIGVTKLAWGEDGRLFLRGPIGQVLTLEGAGPKSIQWNPTDRRAEQVEVRAFITTYGPNPGFPSVPPVVRWRLDYGHGQLAYQMPPVMPYTLEGGLDAYTRNILPARGLCFRWQSRELRITFEAPSKLDGSGPYDQVKISVSFQPVYGSEPSLSPKQHYCADVFPGPPFFNIEPFPPEAMEFRLFDEQGQPYPNSLNSVITFFDLGGQLIAAPSLKLNVFATFQPIPVMAAGWGVAADPASTGFQCSAEYR